MPRRWFGRIVSAAPARRSALAALLAASCASAAPPGAPAPRPPRSVAAPASSLARIDPDPEAAGRIAGDVRYLASPELAGRGTGQDGARLAADFIERRFRELGLEPLGDPGPDGRRGYRQAFPARVGATVEAAKLALASAKAGAPATVDPSTVVTADGSASAEVSAPLVFAGYGIRATALGWDDYGSVDVAGKIVVVLDGAPSSTEPKASPHAAAHSDPHAEAFRDFASVRYKLRTARERKAVGVIVLSHRDELPSPPTDPSDMGLPGVIVKTKAFAPILSRAKLDAATLWERAAASPPKPLGDARAAITTRITPVVATAFNVVGVLRASADGPHRDESVVVGAHYDHLGMGGSASRAPGVHAVHPGADDNASGTALMLEVARRFTRLAARPPRSLVFVGFSAEEIGAIGSRYFVEHPPVPVASMVAMINADMVGRMQNHRLIVDGTGTAAGWSKLLAQASEGLGLDIATGAEGFGASDHASFTAVRVPVAFLFTGVHDDYHKPSDTADKIDAAGESLVATLAARLAERVAARDERLAFVDAPADPHQGMRGGFRVSLGTLPDYAYSGKGVRLSGVRPDAPAQRAGLQAGDVIVKVGEHDITNIHDYMFALGDLEPGRETRIEVERDGKRVPLKIIPAPGR